MISERHSYVIPGLTLDGGQHCDWLSIPGVGARGRELPFENEHKQSREEAKKNNAEDAVGDLFDSFHSLTPP